jgi:hypothetical protein
MLETLSYMLYRMYYYNKIRSSGVSITGKFTVQVNANATREHFGDAAEGASKGPNTCTPRGTFRAD